MRLLQWILVLSCLFVYQNVLSIGDPTHPLTEDLFAELKKCEIDAFYCDKMAHSIVALTAKVVNEHCSLLLHDKVQMILQEAFYYVSPRTIVGRRLNHMLAVLSFSQGDLAEAEKLWSFDSISQRSDLIAQRSYASQILMAGSESDGLQLIKNYTQSLSNRLMSTLVNNGINMSNVSSVNSSHPKSDDSEEILLSILLSEAQGGVRINSPLSDAMLSMSAVRSLDAKQRFRLGVGLAKLGLFDLSLKHVSLSATPWEAPLHRLRAKLVFSPVHSSIRSLALAVDNFERQGESILLHRTPKSPLMITICNSLNEAALALQALPLLHLAGFAAPREQFVLGHSPVALPILLSEVFVSMCPPQDIPEHFKHAVNNNNNINNNNNNNNSIGKFENNHIVRIMVEDEPKRPHINILRVGVVAGSFDAAPGILDGIPKDEKRKIILVAMCFPTPRDATTDRVNSVFDHHINLNPENKSQAIERILQANCSIILFADAALDSRVFAMAHERLAIVQGALWGWGGTTGVPNIDFYFVPEMLWTCSRCPLLHPQGQSHLRKAHFSQPPQLHFSEQVVLLEGIPPVSSLSMASIGQQELWSVLTDRYLMPPADRMHLYLFPASVKHMHPEFDAVLAILLKTDPHAMVVLTTVRTGRDNLPTTHIAARHDLMHPTMPAAAVAKLKKRLRSVLGDMISRVRVLPPLDPAIFRAMQQAAIAVLDPFPVGLHLPILDAMMDGIPVVSAPKLQECTNSHAFNLALGLGIPSAVAVHQHRQRLQSRKAAFNHFEEVHNNSYFSDSVQDFDEGDKETEHVFIEWPSSAEEYAVLAMQLHRDAPLRSRFVVTQSLASAHQQGHQKILSEPTIASHGQQLVSFMRTLFASEIL